MSSYSILVRDRNRIEVEILTVKINLCFWFKSIFYVPIANRGLANNPVMVMIQDKEKPYNPSDLGSTK